MDGQPLGSSGHINCEIDVALNGDHGSKSRYDALKRQRCPSWVLGPWGEGDLQGEELSWAPVGGCSLSLFPS